MQTLAKLLYALTITWLWCAGKLWRAGCSSADMCCIVRARGRASVAQLGIGGDVALCSSRVARHS